MGQGRKNDGQKENAEKDGDGGHDGKETNEKKGDDCKVEKVGEKKADTSESSAGGGEKAAEAKAAGKEKAAGKAKAGATCRGRANTKVKKKMKDGSNKAKEMDATDTSEKHAAMSYDDARKSLHSAMSLYILLIHSAVSKATSNTLGLMLQWDVVCQCHVPCVCCLGLQRWMDIGEKNYPDQPTKW